MSILDWIGKAAVVEHHREVPCRMLEPVPVVTELGRSEDPETPHGSARSQSYPGRWSAQSLLPSGSRT